MREAKAIQQIAQDQAELILQSGVVRAVRGQYIDMILDGSRKQLRGVILAKSIPAVDVGWWVVVVRIPHSNRWIAIAGLESVTEGSVTLLDDPPVPGNVSAIAKPGVIELSWSGLFHDTVTFEVQHNSTASENDATTLKVDGSNYFYWCVPGTTRYFRVRAVAPDYKRSSWSGWVSATLETQRVTIGPGTAYDYNTVDEAIAAITDVSVSKPYTISLCSGLAAGFDLSAKEYIYLEGLGEGTVVEGAILLGSHTGLSHLRANPGAGNYITIEGQTDVVLCHVHGVQDSSDDVLSIGLAASDIRVKDCHLEGQAEAVFITDSAQVRFEDTTIVADPDTGYGMVLGGTAVATTIGTTIEASVPIFVDTNATWEYYGCQVDLAACTLNGTATHLPGTESEEGAEIDHGSLTGLEDDDHTQYLLGTGARAGSTEEEQDFGELGIKTDAIAPSTADVAVVIGLAAGPGYCGFWAGDGVDGTPRTVIPDRAGDVTGRIFVAFSVIEVTGGGTASDYTTPAVNQSSVIYDDGTDQLTLFVAANGSVTIQRTAGTDTFKVALCMVWV